MALRHTLALALAALALPGCYASHRPAGGEGVCCPVTDFTGCSPGAPRPAGGWAPRLEACGRTIDGYDGTPFVRRIDEHGCPEVVPGEGCCGCLPPEPPPPVPACDGLGLLACLRAGCVPVFDDACCPACTSEGGCADCVDWRFLACRSREDACLGRSCGEPNPGTCASGEPACGGARPVGPDSCDVPGCVPSVGPVGSEELPVSCTPIRAESCTARCLEEPPDCPAGTGPEQDGGCYTGRCIPAWVCR